MACSFFVAPHKFNAVDCQEHFHFVLQIVRWSLISDIRIGYTTEHDRYIIVALKLHSVVTVVFFFNFFFLVVVTKYLVLDFKIKIQQNTIATFIWEKITTTTTLYSTHLKIILIIKSAVSNYFNTKILQQHALSLSATL